MKELINAQEILRKVRRTPEAINQQVAHSDRLKSYALGKANLISATAPGRAPFAEPCISDWGTAI